MLALRTHNNDPRKLGELPGASDRDKIEVWSRLDEDGAPVLELVECSWGSGLGWYVQKRMMLDAAQSRALQSLLASVKLPEPNAPARPRPVVRQDGNILQLVFTP